MIDALCNDPRIILLAVVIGFGLRLGWDGCETTMKALAKGLAYLLVFVMVAILGPARICRPVPGSQRDPG